MLHLLRKLSHYIVHHRQPCYRLHKTVTGPVREEKSDVVKGRRKQIHKVAPG